MNQLITSTDGQTKPLNADDSRNNAQHKDFLEIYGEVAAHCTIFFVPTVRQLITVFSICAVPKQFHSV